MSLGVVLVAAVLVAWAAAAVLLARRLAAETSSLAAACDDAVRSTDRLQADCAAAKTAVDAMSGSLGGLSALSRRIAAAGMRWLLGRLPIR